MKKIMNWIAQQVAGSVFSVCLGTFFLFLFGITQEKMLEGMMSFILHPENFRLFLLLCASIAFSPLLWSMGKSIFGSLKKPTDLAQNNYPLNYNTTSENLRSIAHMITDMREDVLDYNKPFNEVDFKNKLNMLKTYESILIYSPGKYQRAYHDFCNAYGWMIENKKQYISNEDRMKVREEIRDSYLKIKEALGHDNDKRSA